MTSKTTRTTRNAAAATAAEFEIPADMRAFAEKSVDQAKVIYGQFKDAAQDAVDILDESTNALKGASTEFHVTALDIAQKNANAGFEFARKLIAAKDLKEVVELQTAFVREQAQEMTEQAKAIGVASTRLGEQTLKPVKDGYAKSIEQMKSVFPA